MEGGGLESSWLHHIAEFLRTFAGKGPTGLWGNRWLLEGVLDPFCPLAAFCAPLDATSYGAKR